MLVPLLLTLTFEKIPMEEKSRKSSRKVKVKRDPAYIYDDDILIQGDSSSDSVVEYLAPSAANSTGKTTVYTKIWSDALEFNINNDNDQLKSNELTKDCILPKLSGTSASQSQRSDRNSVSLEKEEDLVENAACSTTTPERRLYRKNSSTRYSF